MKCHCDNGDANYVRIFDLGKSCFQKEAEIFCAKSVLQRLLVSGGSCYSAAIRKK